MSPMNWKRAGARAKMLRDGANRAGGAGRLEVPHASPGVPQKLRFHPRDPFHEACRCGRPMNHVGAHRPCICGLPIDHPPPCKAKPAQPTVRKPELRKPGPPATSVPRVVVCPTCGAAMPVVCEHQCAGRPGGGHEQQRSRPHRRSKRRR